MTIHIPVSSALLPVLPVPISTQTGNAVHNDCGGVGISIAWACKVGWEDTVEDFFRRANPSREDRGLWYYEIQNVLRGYGIATDWKEGMSLGDLFTCLINNRPAECLIVYKPLVDAGLTKFKDFFGAHWVLVVGISAKTIVAIDPYRDDEQLVSIPFDVWNAAWSKAAIVPRLPLHDMSQDNASTDPISCKVIAKNGAYTRRGPGMGYDIAGIIPFDKPVLVRRNSDGKPWITNSYAKLTTDWTHISNISL